MIVPMKKITLLCLESDKLATLEKLRALGIMHTVPAQKSEAEDALELMRKLSDAERAAGVVSTRKAPRGVSQEELSGEEATQKVVRLLEEQALAEKNLDTLNRDREKLLPWGNFSRKTLEALEQKGIHVYLCASPRSTMNEDIPEGVTSEVISEDRVYVYYALFSREKLDAAALRTVSLPDRSLNETEEQISAAGKELEKISAELDRLSLSLNAIRDYGKKTASRLEFVTNRDGMEKAGDVACLSGYIPAPQLEEFQTAARENGWGLLIDDPAPDDDNVPTLIRKPKWLNIMDPLFDFIGVTPGYRESDVNMFFIFFFPIFFGLIIGDAGYAVLFIATALILKFTVCRGKEAMRLPLNLFLMLSCYSLLWGWLTGNWFGIPRQMLPGFMQGLNFLADPSNSPAAVKLAERLHVEPVSLMKDKFVQFLCFFLAGVHLSLARLVKMIEGIRGNWRALGDLGWAMLIWANFFMAVHLIVFPGTLPKVLCYSLYAAGVVLVSATISGEAALNLPFSLIGSFVDVLSYIRLFAVGLSGAYIATNFNMMGGMVLDAVPKSLYILGLIGLVAVAIFGHVLNIALSFLGVLVHAIRLNTLEFSNHMDMQWAGKKYRPFADEKTEIK